MTREVTWTVLGTGVQCSMQVTDQCLAAEQVTKSN
jgi:hypothetical protein